MYTVLLVIHLAISLVLIGIVLLQHGKGADAGAAFGSGASNTVFGARGSASFLGKLTGVLGAGFFVTSLALAIMAGTFGSGGGSVMERFIDQPASSTGAPAPEADEDGPAPAPEGATAGGRESDAEAPAPPPDGG